MSGLGPLACLLLIIAASVWLGTLAQQAMKKGSFLKGYFLGNRGLGAWALALTATVQSGGTFVGFPSLVYSHGWSVALWIAGYMAVPLGAFAFVGKRMAQVSRRLGAITVPDFFRERYNSPALGIMTSAIIVLFLTVYLIPQFKAGALVMKVVWPGSGALSLSETAGAVDTYYYVGLAVFTLSVVGYTLIGGFLGAVWTDLMQSVLMLVGVVALLVLALTLSRGPEGATKTALEQTGPSYAFAEGFRMDGSAFLPIGGALSFFFIWVLAGMGQPASLVRVMACKDTGTIRRSIALLSVYNALIYIPLVVICICGREIIPRLPAARSDEIIPQLALQTTSRLPGGTILGGLILAAPFGAVMATVSTFLVVIASGVVRDIYQRVLKPDADDRRLRRLSQIVIFTAGAIAVLASIKPVQYLQVLVVFSGTGSAAAFIVPVVMGLFWRRATRTGALAAMIAGFAGMVILYGVGLHLHGLRAFRPYFLLGLDPFVWGLGASLVAGVGVSLFTRPPDPERVALLFDEQPPTSPSTP